MTTTITKIPRFQLDDFGRVKGDASCGFELAVAEKFAGYQPKEPFRVTLWNDGFEATRSLSRDDLASIVDWATMALRETDSR